MPDAPDVDGSVAALTAVLCAVLRVLAEQQPELGAAILAAIIDEPPPYRSGLPVVAEVVRALEGGRAAG